MSDKLQVSTNNLSHNPHCNHGPLLLFKESTREYYACSAFRDRKLCPVFIKKEDFFKKPAKFLKFKHTDESDSHSKCYNQLNKLKSNRDTKISFCNTCKIVADHKAHNLIKNLTNLQLKTPSQWLPAYQDNKSNAQYYFSDPSLTDITNLLISLDFKNILCIGTPRIFEFFQNNDNTEIESFLLDFDERFYNFYAPEKFCRFNMFNYHFLEKQGRKHFRNFLKSSNLAIVLDPPFGGRTEPIIYTLKKIQKLYQKLHKDCSVTSSVAVFWIYPYFMDKFIRKFDKKFQMLPYKIQYENHRKFRDSHGQYGSPIRIFTNLNADVLRFSNITGTKYCNLCGKCVFKNTKHCSKCGKCSFENGSVYHHCDVCKKCVKSSWNHCKACNFCHLNHSCNFK